MISQETKDQIDDIATDIAVTRGTEERRQAVNHEILKYAEKLEEKDKEIGRIRKEYYEQSVIWNIQHKELFIKVKSKDRELAQLKEFQIWFYKKQFGFETDESAQSNIDSDYTEWCKQNLK